MNSRSAPHASVAMLLFVVLFQFACDSNREPTSFDLFGTTLTRGAVVPVNLSSASQDEAPVSATMSEQTFALVDTTSSTVINLPIDVTAVEQEAYAKVWRANQRLDSEISETVGCIGPANGIDFLEDGGVTRTESSLLVRCDDLGGAGFSTLIQNRSNYGFLLDNTVRGMQVADWERWKGPYQPSDTGHRPILLVGDESTSIVSSIAIEYAISATDVSSTNWLFASLATTMTFTGTDLQLRVHVYDVSGTYIGTHGDTIVSEVAEPLLRLQGRGMVDTRVYVQAFDTEGTALDDVRIAEPVCGQTCDFDLNWQHDYDVDMYYGFWMATNEIWANPPTEEKSYEWSEVAIGNPIYFQSR